MHTHIGTIRKNVHLARLKLNSDDVALSLMKKFDWNPDTHTCLQ